MKKLCFFAAAMALAACSETDDLSLSQAQQQAGDGTVNFGVYLNRSLSRAGQAGTNDLDALKQGDGIGVFGYHTNNSQYDAKTSLPNFMYNQQVTWSGSEWTYEPAKYWPNEFGKNAVSEDIDYLTFFAYAPYVKFSPTSGVAEVDESGFDAEEFAQFLGYKAVSTTDDGGNVTTKSAVQVFQEAEQYRSPEDAVDALKMAYVDQAQQKNITGATRNGDKGDPFIRYSVDTNPQTSVDLLWGVAADDSYKGLADGEQPAITAGNPFVNVSKQIGTNDKLQWKFYHALAKLNVQIIAAADVATQGDVIYNPEDQDPLNQVANVTKIYLRSIDFTGFVMKGALNLHSANVSQDYRVKPVWMNDDGTDLTVQNVTFRDGLKDGKEGYTDNLAANENPTGLNPALIEDPTVNENWEGKRPGIPTAEYANLFAGAKKATDPIFVIPTGERMAITVVYDVMTKDDMLSTKLSDGNTKGSMVQNKITQVLKDTKIEAGKAYTIKIVVGMETVKVNVVEVDDWDVEAEQDVDMPYNPARQLVTGAEGVFFVPEAFNYVANGNVPKSNRGFKFKTKETVEINGEQYLKVTFTYPTPGTDIYVKAGATVDNGQYYTTYDENGDPIGDTKLKGYWPVKEIQFRSIQTFTVGMKGQFIYRDDFINPYSFEVTASDAAGKVHVTVYTPGGDVHFEQDYSETSKYVNDYKKHGPNIKYGYFFKYE